MEVVRKTVPSSGSGVTKAALSKLGSAPRLGVGGGIGGSETRSIGGTYNCLNTALNTLPLKTSPGPHRRYNEHLKNLGKTVKYCYIWET